jgi:competence protein ComEA
VLDHPWIRLALGAAAAVLLGLIAARVIASVPRDDGGGTPSGAVAERSVRGADGSVASGVGEGAAATRSDRSEPADGDGDPARPTVSGGSGLTVHVTGAVRRPGVYALSDGSRVVDAVRRAGGATRRADAQGVNQAAELRDGQQVVVPERAADGAAGNAAAGAATAGAAGGSAGTTGATGAAPIDLNTASPEQLQQLDGVGPTTAEKIIRLREERGGIGTVEDLAEIPGIGPKKLEAIRAQVER